MSGKSFASGSVRSCSLGSMRLGAHGPAAPAGASGHEVVLDALYERKRDKKTVRVLTVIIYVFCVSLAAIMLSLYYVFFWEPKDAQYAQRKVLHNVERQIGTTPMPTCFMPRTGGGDSAVNALVAPTPIPITNSFENLSSTTESDATFDFASNTSLPTLESSDPSTSHPSAEDLNGTTISDT